MTSERKNITEPQEWWTAFESAAKAEGLTLSEWIGKQCLAGLSDKVRKKLPGRPPANRPRGTSAD